MLTTLLLTVQQTGRALTLAALALNLVLVYVALVGSRRIVAAVGEAGTAAAGVMLIRVGLSGIIAAGR